MHRERNADRKMIPQISKKKYLTVQQLCKGFAPLFNLIALERILRGGAPLVGCKLKVSLRVSRRLITSKVKPSESTDA